MPTFPAKLISPGLGSSGYYPADTLKRAAEAKVFKRGTQMFWVAPRDHLTRTEDPDRFAAVMESDASWQDAGFDGPGLYADISVFSDYEAKVREKGPYMGLSIVADGKVEMGEAEGYQGWIVTDISQGHNVDFVTKPGRDGKILVESAVQLPDDHRILAEAVLVEQANTAEWLESRLHKHFTILADDLFGDGKMNREERIAVSGAIGAALDAFHAEMVANAPGLFSRSPWQDVTAAGQPLPESQRQERLMNEDEKKQLTEAQAEADRLREQNARLTAQTVVHEAETLIGNLFETQHQHVPAELRQAVKAIMLNSIPLKDGKLDVVALTSQVKAVAEAYKPAVANSTPVTDQGEGADALLTEAQKLRDAAAKRLMERTPNLTEAQARQIVGGA